MTHSHIVANTNKKWCKDLPQRSLEWFKRTSRKSAGFSNRIGAYFAFTQCAANFLRQVRNANVLQFPLAFVFLGRNFFEPLGPPKEKKQAKKPVEEVYRS
jgi:hypothetical protein